MIPNNIASRIIYRDAHCVIVNKIAGEAVEGARAGMADLPRLISAELALSPPLPAKHLLALPAAAHRLDVPVSGCVVFALTQTAIASLNAAFSGGIVEKRYWAIVELPKSTTPFAAFPESGEMVHWIRFESKRNKSTAFDEPGSGRKKAVLRYRLVGSGRDYLFLEIETVTGRHHQIRAQLQRAGLHIKGDLKYGARRSEKNGGIRLHARSLSFPALGDSAGDRVADCRISVQADPPLRDNLWLAFEEAFGAVSCPAALS